MRLTLAFLPLLLTVVACDDPGLVTSAPGSTTPAYERADDAGIGSPRVPVRIGENGPNFPACASRATSRRVVAAEDHLIVRAAPFEGSEESARIAAGSTFFICSRSLDQKWLGVVFDDEGTASPACGVTAPTPRRQEYDGPCRSGWIPSAYVKQGAI